MKYLAVKNYKKLVHQDEVPWIKFNVGILEPTKSPAFAELPDATKCLLYHIWAMAKIHNNRIPEHWLTREKLNLTSRVILDKILRLGLVHFVDQNGQEIVGGDVGSGVDPALDSRAINKAFDFNNQEPLREGESKPKSKAKALVENFVLLPKHREWAAEHAPSVPVETELEAWRDRMRSNGYVVSGKQLVKDPQAAFYTAMRNAEAWGTYKKAGAKPDPPAVPFKSHPPKSLCTVSLRVRK